MTAPALDQRWRDWIRSNVARGCSKDQLFRILHDAGFAHADIVDALGHRPTRPLHCIVNPLAGDAAPSTRPPTGARRHPSRDVELYVFEDFLDAAQCETLLALVRSRTRPSEITHYGQPDPDFRTSSTCDLEDLGHPLPAEISRRMAQTLGIHPARGEPLQGQLYACGQEFKAHVDWFAPGTAEFERHTAVQGQRTWTFMAYLNAVEAGGETVFDRIGERFRPAPGRALAWNNLDAGGAPNAATRHHAMPVRAGGKAVITKWFRERAVGEA